MEIKQNIQLRLGRFEKNSQNVWRNNWLATFKSQVDV